LTWSDVENMRTALRVTISAAALAWTAALVLLRPTPWVTLAGIAAGVVILARRWGSARHPVPLFAAAAWAALAMTFPHRDGAGFGRLYVDQTYHHQALRALNHAAAQGADVSEVLATTAEVSAGDAQGWYRAWTALGDRNLARARALRDPVGRGRALLRAHTYYLRAEFFLEPDDPKRPESFARNRRAFYEGLDTLGVAYERIEVPFGAHHLTGLYYPAAPRPRGDAG
jgi:hypothetical protein